MQNNERLNKLAQNWALFHSNGKFLPKGDEWIFYGGSFDPWHEGHSTCLKLYFLHTGDWPIIIPDRNPHKDLKVINDLEEFYQGLAPDILDKEKYIYPGFILEKTKNPTISWIEKISEKYPQKTLGLLLGFDSFIQLSKWLRFNDLIPKLGHLYVVSRLDREEEKQACETQLKAINSKLIITYLGNHPFEHLSSTQIRNSK